MSVNAGSGINVLNQWLSVTASRDENHLYNGGFITELWGSLKKASTFRFEIFINSKGNDLHILTYMYKSFILFNF